MERVYYSINESLAKMAHDMMSMRDYEKDSKTKEYRSYVDKAYDLVDKIVAERPLQAERLYSMAARYSRRMAEYFNRDSKIGCMCPSILISGGGNFPVKKKERQVQAWDSNRQFYQETQNILSKIESAQYGKDVIKSGDQDAIERLEEKLVSLKDTQERMKAANKAIRMKDVEKADEELMNMGYSEDQIKNLREPDFCGRVGYPSYMLQNNNANIHRIEGRLNQLRAAKEKGTQETEYKLFKVVENTEIMRLQVIFDGKPDQEVRTILKKNGFKWAPSQGAWQRILNLSGKYALNRVKEELEAMQNDN